MIDFHGLKTYSLHDRHSKVTRADFAKPFIPGGSFGGWLASLPGILMGKGFLDIVDHLAIAHQTQRHIILGLGAHVVKVGLNPIIIDLMERGIVTALAMNGAVIVHDAEIAMVGRTSEDVDHSLGSGDFGAARETGELVNEGINRGAKLDIGLGRALGEYLLEKQCPYNELSLLATAARLGVPVSVHVAVGTDIIHIHPSADGASIGKTSHLDFKLFCSLVAALEGGVYLNVGSAVILPEVFLKALTAVRNLGHAVQRFTTVNMDFIQQYRPMTNVVRRPTAMGGRGYHLTGHHELMFPLLVAALLDKLEKSAR